MTPSVCVGVLGANGFVGAAVVDALERRGAVVTRVQAPRLTSRARAPRDLRADLQDSVVVREVEALRRDLANCSVVVNAAGVATATALGHDTLFGADALLPAVVAGATSGGARLVHVSSAAVQGRREVLDESSETAPFSPYSAAKSVGEILVAERDGETVCFRPTSVHGRDRAVTRTLARALRSPVASVAGEGDRPTPQVLVGNVADAIAHVATTLEVPPPVVLQPWEGLTTAGLVRLLGGREPRHLPDAMARAAVATAFRVGRRSGGAAGVARRMEMLWFGQRQELGWLDNRWRPPFGHEAWKELA